MPWRGRRKTLLPLRHTQQRTCGRSPRKRWWTHMGCTASTGLTTGNTDTQEVRSPSLPCGTGGYGQQHCASHLCGSCALHGSAWHQGCGSHARRHPRWQGVSATHPLCCRGHSGQVGTPGRTHVGHRRTERRPFSWGQSARHRGRMCWGSNGRPPLLSAMMVHVMIRSRPSPPPPRSSSVGCGKGRRLSYRRAALEL